MAAIIIIIIIIIIKNECHSNTIVDRLQGCRDLASVTGSQHGASNDWRQASDTLRI